MPSSDYDYDVFLSYTRDHPVGTWVKNRFYKDFVGELGLELGRRPKVFFDQHEIQAGEDWEERLHLGLSASKVLVAICSARYFYDSRYCRMEWYTFGELDLQGLKVTRPRVPVRYNDGDRFPLEAQKTQQADFSESNYIVEAFYKTDARAVLYEDNVRKLARAVVRAIEVAPAFRPEFPVADPSRPNPEPLIQPRL